MKYYETSKFPKVVGNVGFYSVIAICIVAIGAISWFAVSGYNKSKQKDSPTPNISAPDNNSSIIDDAQTIPDPAPSTNSVETQTSQDNVPFEEETKVIYTLPVNGKIIKDYSDTTLQYSATYGDMRMHNGIDISAAILSEIKAAADGKVTETEDNALLGKCITVEHVGGITIKYCGFDTFAVAEGESVQSGRVLGALGSIPSECAEDSHIHIEVKKDGKKISPFEIFDIG